MGQVRIRSSILPALQAVLTGSSTLLGILLVLLWRPNRVRYFPFYSDASHNDPERVLLAVGENLACFFMPLVAIAEHLHQLRCLETSTSSRPIAPKGLRWVLRFGLSTLTVVRLNFFATLFTTVFFFVTANVPSKRPFTPPHQLAASGLIFTYSIQSILKAILAATFQNYHCGGEAKHDGAEPENGKAPLFDGQVHSNTPGWLMFWERHHMKLRLGLAIVLWSSLVGTWLCFIGRKLAVMFQLENAAYLRQMLSSSMAVVVYGATTACVILMGVMAVDMRGDSIVLSSCERPSQSGSYT